MKNPVKVLVDALRRRSNAAPALSAEDQEHVRLAVAAHQWMDTLVTRCRYQDVSPTPIESLRADLQSGSVGARAMDGLLAQYELWIGRIKLVNDEMSQRLYEHEDELERLGQDRLAMFDGKWSGTEVTSFEALVNTRIKALAG